MLTLTLLVPMCEIRHATKASACLSPRVHDPCMWQKKTPIACGHGTWAEQGLGIPRNKVKVAVKLLRERTCQLCRKVDICECSWVKKDTALHFSVIQGIILTMSEWWGMMVAYGVILVGQLDFSTASYNSPSRSKISGAEAVFFVLSVLCLSLQRP